MYLPPDSAKCSDCLFMDKLDNSAHTMALLELPTYPQMSQQSFLLYLYL
jgi:hypothetical protein